MSSTIDDKAYYQSLEDRGHLQRELDEAKKEIARLQRREQEVRAEERERCARAVCPFCAEPEHYGPTKEIEGSKRLWHRDLQNDCNGVVQCQAAAIRRDSEQEGERDGK